MENLKDQPRKKIYGYQVVVLVGDAANTYGHGSQFTIPDIPAKASIQGKDGIGTEQFTTPYVTCQIDLYP